MAEEMRAPLLQKEIEFEVRSNSTASRKSSFASHVEDGEQDLVSSYYYSLDVQNVRLALAGQDLKKTLPPSELRAVEQNLKERAHLLADNKEIEDVLGTSVSHGLSDAVISSRQETFGFNEFRGPKETPLFVKFLIHLISGFGAILWVASLLCILSWRPLGALQGDTPAPINLGLGFVLIGVVVLQAVFNFVQDRKSSKVMKTFKNFLSSVACVKRNGGKITNIPARELIIGDIVIVSSGEKVPADMRIIEERNLKVDNSCLTGESEPISCVPHCTSESLLESRNVLFYGTMVVEGTATAVVFAVGTRTEMGRIASLVSQDSQSNDTSMHIEIRRFVRLIVGLALSTGAICVISWAVMENTFAPYKGFLNISAITTNVIGVVVAFIPEGLPVCITLTLSIIARRMLSQYSVLVKQLGTVETLGAVSVVASDKTGTLTQNVMTLSHVFFAGNTSVDAGRCLAAIVPGHASSPELYVKSLSNPFFLDIMRACVLCNGACVESTEETSVSSPTSMATPLTSPVSPSSSSSPLKFIGSPLDSALLRFAHNTLQFDLDAVQRQWPRIAMIPFNSRVKFMVTIHESTASQTVLYIKGATEEVLKHCSCVISADGREEPLTESIRDFIFQNISQYATKGERVIGIAQLLLDAKVYNSKFSFNVDTPNFPMDGCCFLGLAAVSDPPRVGVKEAVALCRCGQIRVFMVTGDHHETAVSIAKQVGIITKPKGPGKNGKYKNPRLRVGGFQQDLPTAEEIVASVAASSSLVPERRNSVEENSIAIDRISMRVSQDPDEMNRACLVTGPEIAGMTEDDWSWVLDHEEIVFARTTPEHKLMIVRSLQARGEAVAVTGDGVNDAPALKRANVGVAMGSGTEVSREAANMTLLKDDFPSIVKGIEQGRLVFENLQKIILYLLPAGSWSELLPVLANVFIGIPLPLSAFLMIVICVLTDVFASLSLVYQKAEVGLMHRPPRNLHTDHLVTPRLILFAYGFIGMCESFSAFFVFFMFMHDNGVEPGDLVFAYDKWQDGYLGKTIDELNELNYVGQSLFFITLVVCQYGNLLNCATRRVPFFSKYNLQRERLNLRIFPAILASLSCALLITELSIFHDLFQTRPVPAIYWLWALGCSACILCICETRKRILQIFPHSIVAKIWAW